MVESLKAGEIFLAPYPRIHVTILSNNNQLLQVSLSPSPSFSCKFTEENPRKLEVIDWLTKYAKGENQPSLIQIENSHTFKGMVLDFLSQIPIGEVVSYQEVAKAIGNPKAARAVGNVCRTNLFPLFIPCHRVIASDGGLGGFTPCSDLKKSLLEFENLFLS